jgi:hypothetical protein
MKFGFSRCDISPVLPIELAGYGYNLHRVARATDGALEASAIAIEDTSGSRAVLCALDLISVDQLTVTQIEAEVATQLGESSPTILINASHTHSGPATHRLYGAGGYNSQYINQILKPRLSATIVEAFGQISDGEIGIARESANGLSYNRTAETAHDQRVTAIRINAERMTMAGIHFACHPVAYGRNSLVVSSDYPGAARHKLLQGNNAVNRFWLTGCAGDLDPLVRKQRKDRTDLADKENLGYAIGNYAADLYPSVPMSSGKLVSSSTVVEVPVNTDFELNPKRELLAYREARKLPKLTDLSHLRKWLKDMAPIINSFESDTISVPVTTILIGKIMLVGFGAEIYNGTGLELESGFPGYKLVTMMTTNEHLGYIPPESEYLRNSYAARSSAFIFGRKPLTASSEEIFRTGVIKTLSALTTADG